MAESFTAGGSADPEQPGGVWDPHGGPNGTGGYNAPARPANGPNGIAGGVQYNPRTGVADFADGATLGDVQDPRAYGGSSGTVIIGPDGKPMVDPSNNGRSRDVNRFQQTGADAANRAAFQMDYGKGDANRAASQDTAGRQTASTEMLANAAHGGAPSGAVMRGQGATDDSFAAMLDAQAGAKGGVNQAAAGNAGLRAGQQRQLGASGQLASARSSELTGARGAYSTGANAQRAGDYQQQALDQQRERSKMNNQLTQDQLNQQRQIGYEGLAYDVNNAAMRQGMHDDARAAGTKIDESRRDTKQSDRMADFYDKQTADMNKSGGANGPPPPTGG